MSDQRVTRYLKLKDNHPTMVKLAKLYDLAEELGISISFGQHRSFVNDNERDNNLPPLVIEDTDSGEPIGEWPPVFEYKVIYDNPAYLAQEKAEQDDRNKKRQEEEAKREAERKAREVALEKARAKAIEDKERAELARLKAKYND